MAPETKKTRSVAGCEVTMTNWKPIVIITLGCVAVYGVGALVPISLTIIVILAIEKAIHAFLDWYGL